MSNDLSWNDAREARLDRAIDRAVREIMQIDPPPGLRRRVLSRLNAPTETRAFPYIRYALALGSVAALVLVVLATQLFEHVGPPAPPKAPTMATMAAARPIDASTIRIEGDGRPRAGGQITKEPIRMPHVTNVFGARSGEASAATVRTSEPARPRMLERLTPLTIVPLSSRPIVIEPLVLPALPKGGQ
jgi:hypothetical protein